MKIYSVWGLAYKRWFIAIESKTQENTAYDWSMLCQLCFWAVYLPLLLGEAVSLQALQALRVPGG